VVAGPPHAQHGDHCFGGRGVGGARRADNGRQGRQEGHLRRRRRRRRRRGVGVVVVAIRARGSDDEAPEGLELRGRQLPHDSRVVEHAGDKVLVGDACRRQSGALRVGGR